MNSTQLVIHGGDNRSVRLACYITAIDVKNLGALSASAEDLAEQIYAFVNRNPSADAARTIAPTPKAAPAPQAAPQPAPPPAGGEGSAAAEGDATGADESMGIEGQETGGGIRAVATSGKASAGKATK